RSTRLRSRRRNRLRPMGSPEAGAQRLAGGFAHAGRRRARALFGPLPETLDVLLHRDGERARLLDGPLHVGLRQLPLLAQRGVERGDDRLLDLPTAVALGLRRQRVHAEALRVSAAALQVDAEDLLALCDAWEIDEEDLVEAALAQKLRWQEVDPVGCGDHEHGR